MKTFSNGQISLEDGRTLGYGEFGDPRGKPLLFFHGMPGSRFFQPPEEITRKMGFRLITMDRPGYGNSTFQPGRRILDWPTDVTQLADVLGLDQFAVAGHSGGGPYALACAWALPARVTSASSICGAGPVGVPHATKSMLPLNKFGFLLGRFIPWFLWKQIIWLAYRRKIVPSAAGSAHRSRRPIADQHQLNLIDVRENCSLSEQEAFRPGLSGFAWDARLLSRPWGFRLEDIKPPVFLWHGTEDNMTPFPMAIFMAARLPTCHPTFCKGEAHLLIFPHWREILSQLVS